MAIGWLRPPCGAERMNTCHYTVQVKIVSKNLNAKEKWLLTVKYRIHMIYSTDSEKLKKKEDSSKDA